MFNASIDDALRFYRRHLSRYFLFRLLREIATGSYKLAYRSCCLVFHPAAVRRCRLISMTEFQREAAVPTRPFEPSQHVSAAAPRAFGLHAADSEYLTADGKPVIEIDTPKVELVEIAAATAVGGTNLLLAGDAAVHPDCFVPQLHTTPAELLGVAKFKRAEGTVELYLRGGARQVPVVASLLGQTTRNYAHWLTETLPKLPVLDECPEYADVPLLLDADLHANHYESIELINRSKRPVHLVRRWEPVTAQRLIDVSPPAYEPYIPQRLRGNDISTLVNSFAPRTMRLLGETARRSVAAARGAAAAGAASAASKIYLHRSRKSNNLRALVNSDEVEELLRSRGFTLIAPNDLGFADQVAACMKAEIIVAPVGAALANIIFAPPGCRIVVLGPYFPAGNYAFYSNLAAALGHRLVYVLGEPRPNSAGHPMHLDYSVAPADVQRALQWLDTAG